MCSGGIFFMFLRHAVVVIVNLSCAAEVRGRVDTAVCNTNWGQRRPPLRLDHDLITWGQNSPLSCSIVPALRFSVPTSTAQTPTDIVPLHRAASPGMLDRRRPFLFKPLAIDLGA